MRSPHSRGGAEIAQIQRRNRQRARGALPVALVGRCQILLDHRPADLHFAPEPPGGHVAGQPAGVRQRAQGRDTGVQQRADHGTVRRLGVESEVYAPDRRRGPRPDLFDAAVRGDAEALRAAGPELQIRDRERSGGAAECKLAFD